MLLAPQDIDGQRVVRQFGDGSNRWAVVHAGDLGDLYALAVEGAPGGSVCLGANEDTVRVRDAAKAVADTHGARIQDWDPAQARQYWSVLVEALMLDQHATIAKARAELGWQPRQHDLLDELGTGTVRTLRATSPATTPGR